MSSSNMTGNPAATRWRLDPDASTAEFRVPTFWGLVRVSGHFGRLDGWLEVESHGWRRLELTIDATSVDTGNDKRDQHLRSADFFDTEHYPRVRFVSSAIVDEGDGRLHVAGELRAAGRRVAMELEPVVHGTSDQLRVDVSTTVDQRELGMIWSPLGMTRNPATLTVHAELRPDG